MTDSKSKYRAPVYVYLKSHGFEMKPEDHEAIKQILITYVQKETENLRAEALAYRKHIPKCELYKAKRQAKADRKNQPNAK